MDAGEGVGGTQRESLDSQVVLGGGICMSKVFVGVIRSSVNQRIEFAVSQHRDLVSAREEWADEGLEVLDVITVDAPSGSCGNVASAVLRSLASTAEGVEVLGRVLGAVAEHQRSWTEPSKTDS